MVRCNYLRLIEGYIRFAQGGDIMELAFFFGALVSLAVSAYLRGYDSRDGRRELW